MEFGDYNKIYFFFLGGFGGFKVVRIVLSNIFFKFFCKIEGKIYLILNVICCVFFICVIFIDVMIYEFINIYKKKF